MKYSIYILFLLVSCTNSEALYEYNGVMVTRIDKNAEVRLYYGDLNDKGAKHPYVKVKYSGFDDGVSAFLLFNPDRSVEVINYGLGHYTQSKNAGKEIVHKRYDNPELDSIVSQEPAQRMNLIRISDVIELEEQLNRKYQTGVKAIYK